MLFIDDWREEMFKNYLKIAIRTLLQYKGFSFINITGLAVGLACSVLIMLYLQHELGYDRFHDDSAHIYRIQVEETSAEAVRTEAGTPFPLAPALIQDFPELENTARFLNFEEALITIGEKRIYEDGIIFAEPKFLDIFTFPLLVGDRQSALTQPNTIILTESMARKYFGDANPLGQTLHFNNAVDFIVTGVAADVPANSHFSFNFIGSLAGIQNVRDWDTLNQWGMHIGTYTYTLLAKGVDATALESKIAPALEKYDRRYPNQMRRLKLQPIKDIHLFSHVEGELAANNYAANLYIIATIGLLILLVASINFMNLSTARSVRRAREVGMRKMLGAGRIQLLRQYLGESILLTIIAMLFSLLLVEMLLPVFNHLTGKSLAFPLTKNLLLPGFLLSLTFIVGVMSGLYPAFVLAAFKPAETLKNLKTTGRGRMTRLTLRKVLVVSQFAISILLITSAFIVERQLVYFHNAKLGFEKDMMLVVQMNADSKQKVEVIKNTWRALPGVKAVTASYKSPIGFNEASTSLYPIGDGNDGQFKININSIDYDFSKVFGLEFLAGRNFSPDFPADEQRAIVVNESTVKKLGFTSPEEAIGKVYRLGINRIDGEIIGVVKDFHITSMQTEIEPLVILYWPEVFDVFSVKIQSGDISETIAALETSWQRLVPNFPFQYRFLDDYINSLYQQEEQTRRLVATFSLLTIFIACLGLFGLSAFSTEQRTKEVGVRKVLGASVTSLVGLLSRDFLKLVLIANLIAWPVAYLTMNKWLQNFAYHIGLSWWIFVLSGVLALMIALATVGYQAIRAATANPVESLRYE